jgi:hypothetical protein
MAKILKKYGINKCIGMGRGFLESKLNESGNREEKSCEV